MCVSSLAKQCGVLFTQNLTRKTTKSTNTSRVRGFPMETISRCVKTLLVLSERDYIRLFRLLLFINSMQQLDFKIHFEAGQEGYKSSS